MALTATWISLASLYRAAPESLYISATDDAGTGAVDETLIDAIAWGVESEFAGAVGHRYSGSLAAKTASAAVTKRLTDICAWEIFLRGDRQSSFGARYEAAMQWVDMVARGDRDINEWTEDGCAVIGKIRFTPLKDIYDGPSQEGLEFQGALGAHHEDEW